MLGRARTALTGETFVPPGPWLCLPRGSSRLPGTSCSSLSAGEAPGAGDNLVASVLAMRFAREIAARKGELLQSTRLRVVSFDSEEAGLRGASAYMRAHAEELKRLPCYHLNFDSIYQLGHLQALTSDINGTVRLSTEMVETLETCARENGHAIGRFGMLFRSGRHRRGGKRAQRPYRHDRHRDADDDRPGRPGLSHPPRHGGPHRAGRGRGVSCGSPPPT